MDSVMMDSVMMDRLGEAAMGSVMDSRLGGTNVVGGGVRHGPWTQRDKTQEPGSLRSTV